MQARARRIVEDGISAARALISPVEPAERLGTARAVVLRAVRTYWEQAGPACRGPWPLREPPPDIEPGSMPEDAEALAAAIGEAAAMFDPIDSAYMIGAVYTTMMPDRVRSQFGAYYTPPALCEQLLDMASDAGVDWARARVLDPACGGGAFLAPVARRMTNALADQPATRAIKPVNASRAPCFTPAQAHLSSCALIGTPCRSTAHAASVLKSIEDRLVGFELDPFAAWLSQVTLDTALADLCEAAGARLRNVVRVCDSLGETPDGGVFDLVVGNPPYGRVSLAPPVRRKYARSLFGHANLYGLFTDLALRFARENGVVAYVTPTSFLSGEYFKALRRLLGHEAPPVSLGLVRERKGVFAQVLQEAMLAVYRRGANTTPKDVFFMSAQPGGSITRKKTGRFKLPDDPEKPWLIPRDASHNALLRHVDGVQCRLADLGYTVSTGPLVWNRHKDGLRDAPGTGTYPLVWAESVRRNGVFEFRAEKRNHKPYFEPKPHERWVVTNHPCVLLQRTTAKEQCRRLIAAELPASFIERHGAVVVENHVNMIKPLNGKPKVTPATLAAVLNSDVVDQLFRCINGSVAVSAYELEALPLPSPHDLGEIERLLEAGPRRETLELAVARMYTNGSG